ncbi:MAG: hypothetical protein BJ554DRAFT_6795, partial [Olpidium bornovanus]
QSIPSIPAPFQGAAAAHGSSAAALPLRSEGSSSGLFGNRFGRGSSSGLIGNRFGRGSSSGLFGSRFGRLLETVGGDRLAISFEGGAGRSAGPFSAV